MLSFEPTDLQLLAAPWMRFAFGEEGVREIRGEAHNPRVLGYLASCEGKRSMLQRDETAWCSAFVNWCMQQVRIQRTRSLGARSWIDYGESSELRFGALVVLWRKIKLPAYMGGKPLKNAPGHVGFCVDRSKNTVQLIGGNQGNRVSVLSYPRDQIIAVRFPTEVQLAAAKLINIEA